MKQFVIQRHEKKAEPVHWDLMLEAGDILKTYRLDQPPEDINTPVTVTPIFDHEKRFLTYEGPVNKGLGRVNIVERGTYQTQSQTQTEWTIKMEGSILKGVFVLAIEGEVASFQPVPTTNETQPNL